MTIHLLKSQWLHDDHDYEISNSEESCSRCFPRTMCMLCCEKSRTIRTLLETIKRQQHEIDLLKNKNKRHFSINKIKESYNLITFYIGLQSYEVFKWLYESLSHKVTGVHFLQKNGVFSFIGPCKRKTKAIFHFGFSARPNTIAILECTEGGIEKPSLAKAQAQTYSSYKRKKTLGKNCFNNPWSGFVYFESLRWISFWPTHSWRWWTKDSTLVIY